jgi:hypothetical protein
VPWHGPEDAKGLGPLACLRWLAWQGALRCFLSRGLSFTEPGISARLGPALAVILGKIALSLHPVHRVTLSLQQHRHAQQGAGEPSSFDVRAEPGPAQRPPSLQLLPGYNSWFPSALTFQFISGVKVHLWTGMCPINLSLKFQQLFSKHSRRDQADLGQDCPFPGPRVQEAWVGSCTALGEAAWASALCTQANEGQVTGE